MIYPGSQFWNRVSDKWLVSKVSSRLLAVSSALTVAVTLLLYSNFINQHSGAPWSVFYAILGVSGALSIFFLWGGMWRYWLLGEPSNRFARRIWFAILILGLWYGAVLYYLLVYLPGKEEREIEHVEEPANRSQIANWKVARDVHGRMKKFEIFLLSAWLLVFVVFGLLLSFPRIFLPMIAFLPYFSVMAIGLMIVSGAYLLICVYRAGMTRAK